MSPKTYSVEEANALLPFLAPTLVELRDKYVSASEIREKVEGAARGNGGSSERDRWAKTVARVDELIERLQEWEVMLRDLESGLVDFPAVIEGQEGWLCWRLGEPEVAFWHPRDEGYSGRRPL